MTKLRQKRWAQTRRALMIGCLLSGFLIQGVSEARVGGGRTFGNRGSRGFSAPGRSTGLPSYNSNSYNSSPYRSGGAYHSNGASRYGSGPYSNQPVQQGPSVWKSLGAGLAGGFLGSMLFRSLGGGSGLGAYGGYGSGGGFGLLELLLLGGLLYLVIRMLSKRSEAPASAGRMGYGSNSPSVDREEDESGAARLMREARPSGFSRENLRENVTSLSGWRSDDRDEPCVEDRRQSDFDAPPISTEVAMDLFFQIQGAWGTRDLSSVQTLLDGDVKNYLEEQINQLKAARHVNRLENIAVRNTQVVESWYERGRDYSTVKITANLLDFTVQEDTQQIVEGSRTTPVKFEELWTFVREHGSPQWKLSAIQQV